MNRSLCIPAVLCAALVWGLGPAAVAAPTRFAIVQEIMHDGNAPRGRQDEFLDTSFHIVWPQQHVSLLFGSFSTGAEWGGFLRDRRGSSYGLSLRRRTGGFVHDTAVEFDTHQRWRQFLASVSTRLFWPDEPETSNLLLVPAAGVQVYYRDASYASILVTRDPRPGTGTTFRFANHVEFGDLGLDVAIAPRTDGALQWGVGARFGIFSAGYGREPDFDFTRLDRHVFSFGLRWDFPRP